MKIEVIVFYYYQFRLLFKVDEKLCHKHLAAFIKVGKIHI